MTGRNTGAIVAAIIGILILLGLGVWQLQRLSWKEGLLAAIAERLAAPPVSLAEALAAGDAGRDVEFLKVAARGRFLHASEKLMFASFEGKPGFSVITPFVSDDGIAVLVDRGMVPESLRDTKTRAEGNPQGPVEITGIVRRERLRNPFSPDNDAEGNLWFWWDVPAMLGASDLPSEVRVAPFTVQALPGAGDAGLPRPERPEAPYRNNHLGYAITWFSLAVVLAVIAFLFVRGQIRKSIA
jgi:surfeit locus 1 family protein